MVLLFSFFFCSGGFLVAHGESRPDLPGYVTLYGRGGEERKAVIWDQQIVTGLGTVGSFYGYTSAVNSGSFSLDRLRYYYHGEQNPGFVLEKGGTYLFALKAGFWTGEGGWPFLRWMNSTRISLGGIELDKADLGSTISGIKLSSWIYDSTEQVSLIEVKMEETVSIAFLDIFNTEHGDWSFSFSPVPTFELGGVSYSAVASGFWTITSSIPPDGGVVDGIENQTTVIISSINNSTQTITNAITNQTTTITNQISDSTSILKGAVEQAGQQISDKVDQAASDITGKVDETGQAIQDKIDEQYDISDASQVGEAAQGFADQASESLGVVSYVDTLFSGLSGLVTAGSTTLTFPAFAIAVQGTDYQVWEEHTFDLSQLDGWFSGLMAAVRLATSVVVVGAVIHYLQSVYKDVIG